MSGTVSSNLTPANGPGLAYTANGEDWTIAPGILVASNDSDGVVSTFDDATLHNLGTVLSGADNDGVSFTAGGFVENGSTGLIVGGDNGVVLSGGSSGQSDVVINAGTIQASLYAVGISGDGAALFSNSGTVAGLLVGAFVTAAEGSRIVNSGIIEGNLVGLGVAALDAGSTIEIINSGTIRVGSLIAESQGATLFAVGGSVVLTNTGTIIGDVELDGSESGARATNSGLIEGEITLGVGADTFDGSAGTQGAVHGENGDDFIIGGIGNDALYGELGNDTLKGGGGADQFWFTTTPDSKTNRDKIRDFSDADGDRIVLDLDIYTGLGDGPKLKAKYFEVGNKPHSKNDKIVYNEKKGLLIYAENGSKTDKAEWVKFAVVDKGTDLDHASFVLA